MAADMATLKAWFDAGVKQGATHMVVVCDTYDWDDYPVYVSPAEDARVVAKYYNGKEMQRLMEVYNLSMSKDAQFASSARVYNY